MLDKEISIAERQEKEELTGQNLVSQKLGSQIAKASRAAVAALAMGVVTLDSKKAETQTLPGVEDNSVMCDIRSVRAPVIAGSGARVTGAVNDGRRSVIHSPASVSGLTLLPYPDYFALTPSDVDPSIQMSTNHMAIVLPDGRYFVNSGGSSVAVTDDITGALLHTGGSINMSPNGRGYTTVGMTQLDDENYCFYGFGTLDDSFRRDQLHAICYNPEDDTITRDLLYDGSAGPLPVGVTGGTLTAINADEKVSLVFLTFETGPGKTLALGRDRQVVVTLSSIDYADNVSHPENPHNLNMKGGGNKTKIDGTYEFAIGGVNYEHNLINCTYISLNGCEEGQVMVDGDCYTICEDGEILEGDQCREETCEDRDDCEVPVDPTPEDPNPNPEDPEDPVDPTPEDPNPNPNPENPVDPTPEDPNPNPNPNPNPEDPNQPLRCDDGQVLDPIGQVCVTVCPDGTIVERLDMCGTSVPNPNPNPNPNPEDPIDPTPEDPNPNPSPRPNNEAKQNSGCSITNKETPLNPINQLGLPLLLIVTSVRRRLVKHKSIN